MGVKGVMSVVLLVFTIIIMIGLWLGIIFVMPRCIAIFNDMGAKLPPLTLILLSIRQSLPVVIFLGFVSIGFVGGLVALVAKESLVNKTMTLAINAAALALVLLAAGLFCVAMFMQMPALFGAVRTST